MFGVQNYPGFVLAAILLNITPGADTFYVLTRCVSQGRMAGLVSVAGIGTGCLVHLLCAAFGLSVILSASTLAFNLVKWAGAAYLIYLGVRTMLSKTSKFDGTEEPLGKPNLVSIYRQGIVTDVLNPKVALFFLSFLPQFINPDLAQGPLPFLLLGGTFLTTGTIWLALVASFAAVMTRTLRENRRVGMILNRVSGIVFIGFGLRLALESK